MIVLEGPAALSQFRLARLEAKLQSSVPSLRIRAAWQVFFVDPEAGADVDLAVLRRILQAKDAEAPLEAGASSRYIVPRFQCFTHTGSGSSAGSIAWMSSGMRIGRPVACAT